ncbi:hypothetical protein HGRIS_007713 [Hohenbuehelia grisea]|uniref:Uncharacterized protein n=1 Tax=Hohenbuehelia grisea TaxID=104357 RepID=A0ABR3J5P9_9AGAR
MNGDRPTEVTALLDRARSPDAHFLPSIAPTLAHVDTLDVQHITADDLCPYELSDRPAEVAYSLIVLLQLRANHISRPATASARNPWEQWKQEEEDSGDIEVLETQIDSLWRLFVAEYRTLREIEDLLWLAFPENDDSRSRSLRGNIYAAHSLDFFSPTFLQVVDFLYHEDGPQAFVTHRLVSIALLRRWRDGRLPPLEHWASISPQILVERYENLCTPRVLHLLDISCQVTSLCLLASYLLYPPIVSIVEPSVVPNHGVREAFIVVLSASLAARPWSFLNIPPLFVFCAFLFSIPSIPIPGGNAFGLLHVAFALHVFNMHLPVAPSPLFLLPFDSALPFATLLSQSTSTILIPVLQFFFPVFLLGIILLSSSLVDTFTVTSLAAAWRDTTFFIIPPPIETRTTFLFFTLVTLVSFFSAIGLLVVFQPHHPGRTSTLARWDRYTTVVGIEARRSLIRAVVTYSTPYTFPSPFNLAQLLLVKSPVTVMKLCRVDAGFMASFERNLWRLLVGPFATALWAIFWAGGRK